MLPIIAEWKEAASVTTPLLQAVERSGDFELWQRISSAVAAALLPMFDIDDAQLAAAMGPARAGAKDLSLLRAVEECEENVGDVEVTLTYVDELNRLMRKCVYANPSSFVEMILKVLQTRMHALSTLCATARKKSLAASTLRKMRQVAQSCLMAVAVVIGVIAGLPAKTLAAITVEQHPARHGENSESYAHSPLGAEKVSILHGSTDKAPGGQLAGALLSVCGTALRACAAFNTTATCGLAGRAILAVTSVIW